MEVIIRPTPDEAAQLVARVFAKAVRANPRIVLGLATGRTMDVVYRELVRMHQSGGLDFSLCRAFNLGEYVGVPPDDYHSYRYYINDRLLKRVNIDLRNTHMPDGMAKDLEAECRRYEDLIQKSRGIDLQLLGLGQDGHIGFNEALSALRSRTRVKALTPVSISQNASFFGGEDKVPRWAITMGVGTILECRRCLLLVTGRHKAETLAKAVEGPLTGMISATALQLHPHCTVVVDEAAAERLTGTDYYRWVFENEPEWADYR